MLSHGLSKPGFMGKVCVYSMILLLDGNASRDVQVSGKSKPYNKEFEAAVDVNNCLKLVNCPISLNTLLLSNKRAEVSRGVAGPGP